jgi:ectoine hydroxylase-related dioxygenase (phytanoyl-CoA dioxygenase family)
VSTAILGDGFANVFYSGNTAMPSEERQPVHADTGQLWPHLKAPTPPYQLVVNIPLVDMGPENGSTELWPGTHTYPTVTMSGGDIKVRPEVLAARRIIEPPIQPVVSAGSILIRDIRLWHAGMPNRTAAPRPMIAMIHTVPWYSTGNMQFRRDAEPFVLGSRIIHRCEFLDEVDYIRAPSGFEFPRVAAES